MTPTMSNYRQLIRSLREKRHEKLVFKELFLVSAIQQAARRIKFHPLRTVISGDNEVGKSALLKSIYASFGADAPVNDQAWLNGEVVTLLRFELDGLGYSVLHDRDSYTLFNADDVLVGTHRGVRGGWASRLAGLFDFHLKFFSSSGEQTTAHPAYLFAPFYIDQDKGWSGPWSSFARLRSSRRDNAVEYHVGIRPNEYFTAKAELDAVRDELLAPEQELAVLRRMFNDADSRLGTTPLNVDTNAFSEDVDRLVAACEQLQRRESEFRTRMMTLENERISLQAQSAVVGKAANELRKDYNFAVAINGDQIECPTCGAQYANSIVDTFLIAQDEDRCIDFVSRLTGAIAQITEQIDAERQAYESVVADLARINEALNVQREQVTLRDVIQSEGKRKFRARLAEDIASLDVSTDELRVRFRDAKRTLRKTTDRKRQKQIKVQYASALEDSAIRLGVAPAPDVMKRSVTPKIESSGSNFPRRLFAYYMAILRTIYRNTSSTYCPFVVDAVNQQDQGGENLTALYEVLASGLPSDTQLILSCVNTHGVTFDGDTIELTEKRGLLRASDYAELMAIVRPFSEARYKQERENEPPMT